MPHDLHTITSLARAYRDGSLSPVEVTQAYLSRLEPGAIYRLVTPERALKQAQSAEDAFRQGRDLGPLQGVPIALKDLIDTAGDVTAAGSRALESRPPALRDAPIAETLERSGAVFLGKTGMTELAFSGLGLNPHYGTPGNAHDPERIPGGSSSGSAVAVAKGLAVAAVGSDTGGSVRIPASFNGIVGLKTTDGLIPTEGCVPLSSTLDTLGPITRTVEDAHLLFNAMRGTSAPFAPEGVKGMKLYAPVTVLQEGLEESVGRAFGETCRLLEGLGTQVEHLELAPLQEAADAYPRYGSFAAHESFVLHEELLTEAGDLIDPRVSKRILQYRDKPARDYIRLMYARKRLAQELWEAAKEARALLAPTVAILPPKIADLAEDDAYFRANSLVLRNTQIFNFLGLPALSVPCGITSVGLPVGFMIVGRPHDEATLLSIGQTLETALR